MHGASWVTSKDAVEGPDPERHLPLRTRLESSSQSHPQATTIVNQNKCTTQGRRSWQLAVLGGKMARSIATGFAKRLSWSHFVMEGLEGFLHVLTPDRRILYASPSCKAVTGFERDQLEGRFVSAFIHPDDYGLFLNALNESVSRCSPVRFIYRFRKADWDWIILESSGHAHISNEPSHTWLPQYENNHRGFFMMAQPYLSENGTRLDSFLEHKIENERLLTQKAALEHGEQAGKADGGQELEIPKDDLSITSIKGRTILKNDHLGVPSRTLSPQMTSIGLVAASIQPRSSEGFANCPIPSKFSSQMVDSGHLDHNKDQDECMSNGTSSFVGDAGIPISKQINSRAKMKTKKRMDKQRSHVAEPHICSHCSTLVSPEWRNGPDGPKSLCNACGCG